MEISLDGVRTQLLRQIKMQPSETVWNQARKTGGPRPRGSTNALAGGKTEFGKTISQVKPSTTKAEINSGNE